MKKLIALVTVIQLIFFISGCESTSSITSNITSNDSINYGNLGTAPAISNLRFTPQSASLGAGGGAINRVGYIDFIDNDGDIKTGYLQTVSETSSAELSGLDSVLSGTIRVVTISSTEARGNYPFTFWVVDSKGNKSNTLAGIFSVE